MLQYDKRFQTCYRSMNLNKVEFSLESHVESICFMKIFKLFIFRSS